MSNDQRLTKTFDGHEVRIVRKDGEPWFIVRDVFDALGFSQPTSAVSRLHEDEKKHVTAETAVGPQKMNAISKKELKRFLATSQSPNVSAFAEAMGVDLTEVRHETIEVLDGSEVRIVDDDPLAFVLTDVAETLGYSRASMIARHIKTKYKTKHGVQSSSGPQQMLCSTLRGLKQALAASRKPKATELAGELGMDVMEVRPETIEAETERRVRKVFGSEEIERQVEIGGYQVDLFFPKYGLVVEIDEEGHQDYNQISELGREYLIESAGLEVIRYNPDGEPIEVLFKQVYEYLMERQEG